MLYFLRGKGHCDSYKLWANEFKANHFCPQCQFMRPEYLTNIFDVYLNCRPNKAALNVSFVPRINIARLDFLELFWEEVRVFMKLGKVYGDGGLLQEGFLSFTADRLLPIRGSKKTTYKGKCSTCRRYRYLPKHPWYVVRDSLFDQQLFVPWPIDGLVLNEELFSRIDRKKWKGIDVFELPIVDEPLDGIDEIPNDLVIGGSR